jgi:antitoxin (DNA-binding transcriptional repressor) of toxin-antitoxin stability system
MVKFQLRLLLEQVAKGETIIITKHGVPVPRLIPCDTLPIEVRQTAINQMIELRSHNLSGGEAQAWIKAGRLPSRL